MNTLDPFTLTYSAIWEILEASEDFCEMVPVKNRIKYVEDGDSTQPSREPDKRSHQPADYPQVTVIAKGGPTDHYWSSSGSRVGIVFEIWVYTGDKRLCYLKGGKYYGLLPLQWTILRAMMDWKTYTASLSWRGETGFVTHFAPHTRKDSLNIATPAEPTPSGWYLTLEGKADMHFDSTLLLP